MTTDVYPRENCIAPAIVFIVWTTNTKKYAQGQQAKQCLLPMAKHLSEALDNAEQPMLIVRRSNCAQDEGRPLCSAFGHALCTTRSAHAAGAGDKPFWPLQGSNSSSTTARDSAERVTGALYCWLVVGFYGQISVKVYRGSVRVAW